MCFSFQDTLFFWFTQNSASCMQSAFHSQPNRSENTLIDTLRGKFLDDFNPVKLTSKIDGHASHVSEKRWSISECPITGTVFPRLRRRGWLAGDVFGKKMPAQVPLHLGWSLDFKIFTESAVTKQLPDRNVRVVQNIIWRDILHKTLERHQLFWRYSYTNPRVQETTPCWSSIRVSRCCFGLETGLHVVPVLLQTHRAAKDNLE